MTQYIQICNGSIIKFYKKLILEHLLVNEIFHRLVRTKIF